MTVTMSSEGDSSKSVLSESNEKSGTDNNTDTSQDSHDVSDAKIDKPAIENDVDKKGEAEKPKAEVEPDDKPSEKKAEVDKTEDDKKPQNNEEDTKNEEDKKDKKDKKKVEEEKSDESEKDDEDGSEKDSEKDDKKDVPLLDQPLEKSGKRERKNVQRFNEEFAAEVKEGAKIEFEGGSGSSLGEIPRVDASISRFKNEDLKLLHRLLFKVSGKNPQIKKNIRKFNGFEFKKDSEEYSRKISAAHKFEVKHLKSICEMLDLQKNGTKDDIIERVIDFLLEPKDSGKPVGGGRPKRTAAVKANNRGYSSHDDYSSDEKHSSRARRDKGRRMNLKDDSSSDEEFQPIQSDGSEEKPRISKRKRRNQKKESSDEEEEGSVASVATSDESDDEPKAKRKKSPAKVNNKTKPKGTPATPGKRGRPPASTKKTPNRGKKEKFSSDEEDESDHKDEGSSSEDEPLVKKAKNTQPPTDDEIKTFIKGILEGANLEEITMKTVCQRVYGHYPDFDLTHKKDFIKSTVKSLIST